NTTRAIHPTGRLCNQSIIYFSVAGTADRLRAARPNSDQANAGEDEETLRVCCRLLYRRSAVINPRDQQLSLRYCAIGVIWLATICQRPCIFTQTLMKRYGPLLSLPL